MSTRIGHNRPPKPRDPRDVKIEMIQRVMNSWAYSANEALALVGIIANSNTDFEARLTADQIMTYLKTRRKPTIWPVIRNLEKNHGVVVRDTTGGGRANTYRILPDRVIDSVIDHYENRGGRQVPERRKKKANQYAERTGNQYGERTGSEGQTSTLGVPVTSTPSVPVNAKKSNDSTCAPARDARAPASSPSSKESNKKEKKEEEGAMPEIEGLNGNTAQFVKALAEADQAVATGIRPPDYETAYKHLVGYVRVYGAEVVSVGCLQWQIGVQQKAMKNPLKSFGNYIDNIKKDRDRAEGRKTLRGKGISSFSELIERGES